MIVVATSLKTPAGDWAATADQRVVAYGVPWSHYEVQLALRGEKAVPRIAYLEGALELMSPSREHERIKEYLGDLIKAYASERGIELSGYGSWTLKSAPRESGLEPDACYIVGDDPESKPLPDLAIEVVLTSGGLDKLEVYRRLGIGEVWFWQAGRIDVHVLREGRYAQTEQSALFPGLDLELVRSLLDQPTPSRAVRVLRERLREAPSMGAMVPPLVPDRER